MANDNLKSKILDKNSLKIKSLSFATVFIYNVKLIINSEKRSCI
jgi:hypothetical protein